MTMLLSTASTSDIQFHQILQRRITTKEINNALIKLYEVKLLHIHNNIFLKRRL